MTGVSSTPARRPRASIAGIGLTRQAKQLDTTTIEICLEAATAASADAGMTIDDIDGIAARWPGPGGTVFDPGAWDWTGIFGKPFRWIGDTYPQGVPGALMAYVGLFGPGVILIFAMVPFWARLRHNKTFKAILKGVNATAIGLVGAACVILWESAVKTSADAIVFCIAFTMAVVFAIQAPICILVGGIVGAILHPDAADLGQIPYCEAQGYVEPAAEVAASSSGRS